MQDHKDGVPVLVLLQQMMNTNNQKMQAVIGEAGIISQDMSVKHSHTLYFLLLVV